MKLTHVQVKNFRSAEDTGLFEIGDLTCLVGKNEAGKTAVLHAIYGQKPNTDYTYEKTRDYPRRHLNSFDTRHPEGESIACITTWKLSKEDINAVDEALGEGALTSKEVSISSYIGRNTNTWNITVDDKIVLSSLSKKHKLDATEQAPIKSCTNTESAIDALTGIGAKTKKQEEILEKLQGMRKGRAVLAAIDILEERMPHFFYTSHFERMSGEIAVNKLTDDIANNRVSPGDQIFLDFLSYAGTSIDELKSAKQYEQLKAKCEGASNEITDEIFDFWSQNDALSIEIELGEGKAKDPKPFNSGTIVKIRIKNENHRVSVPLSERSAGFIWFFSFLSQFKKLKKHAGDAILLLDEPGLTLHGKAQSDLLRYIKERLLPDHQVIYTTHSPFLVPSDDFASVRVVEDVVEYPERRRKAIIKGTKVTSEVLAVDSDTLFPLQAQMGYGITQSLFVGENTLLVEGPSDVLYLQAFSNELKRRQRTHLDPKWIICPSGGLDKVWSFVSLFAGNGLNVAVLCDHGNKDKAKIQRLREREILATSHILTTSDFADQEYSDIEDIIGKELYVELLNECYAFKGDDKITSDQIKGAGKDPRTVKQTENVFRTMSPDKPEFDHFTPSSWLINNPDFLRTDRDSLTLAFELFEKVFTSINELKN